jgi:exopolysaccharide biosynthesis polyprenyl glycosylphosphotransferase
MREVSDRTPGPPGEVLAFSHAGLAAALTAAEAGDRHREQLLRRWEGAPALRSREARRTGVHRPRWLGRYTRLVVAADVAAVATAVLLTGIRPHGPQDLLTLVAASTALLLVLALGGAYQHRFVGSGGEEFRRLAVAGTTAVALSGTAGYAAGPPLQRLAVLGTPTAVVLVIAVHLAAREALRRGRRRGRFAQRVLVLGLERSVAELVRATRRDPTAGLRVVGACVRHSSGDHVEGVPVLGAPEAALTALRACRADTVLLASWSDVAQEDLRRLAWNLEGSGVQLLVAPRVAEVALTRLHIRAAGGVPLLRIEEPEFTGVRRVAKAALDYGGAATGLLMLSPLLLVLAALVKLTSAGPVFFRQERVGLRGSIFRMHKFRTMATDAEDRLHELEHLNELDGGPMFKIRNDPRVTPLGRVLRRWSLDELPQLIDVLTGSMSLVGPRPPLLREVERYEHDVRRRLLVKPGITGLWQVSGRSDLSWEDTVRTDLSYVENWHLGLDLSIILRTLRAVVRRSGAY